MLGCKVAAVFIATLSAPDLKIDLASSTDLTPPPTVIGINISWVNCFIKSIKFFQ
jgi:hypothetical protein